MSLFFRVEHRRVKCNRCGAFNKMEGFKGTLVFIFSCVKCGELNTV